MTRYEIAKAHTRNRQQIKKSITQVNRSLNQSIKDNVVELQNVNIRTMVILYSAYLESSLGYIVHFYGAQISISLKDKTLEQNTEIDKWNCLVDEMFRLRYLSNKQKEFNLINLGHTNYNRYLYIKELLTIDIRSIIEIRNKLAHGQWAVAFTSDGNTKNQEVTAKIWKLSKKDVLRIKHTIMYFIKTIESLVSSEENFEVLFDGIVHNLEKNKQEYEEKYNWIIESIKKKKYH